MSVKVSHTVVPAKTQGSVKVESSIKFGMIRIGLGGIWCFGQKRSRGVWNVVANVIFEGKASIGFGKKLSVYGDLIIRNNFAISVLLNGGENN